MTTTAGARRYQLLGDVRAYDGDDPIDLGALKPRAVLAILLLRAGTVVSTDVLCDLLWDGAAPPSATTTLHGYISGLRRALGADVIRTRAPGYVVETDALDVTHFNRLHALGRQAAGDGEAAASALREALDLWHGPALSEFASQRWAVGDAVRLDESRLRATDDWALSELLLGRHAEIVEELQTVVRRAPLREDLRARLVLALYRSGRQAEALQVLADGREILADELGIDPGPELVALQTAVLAQDPALDWREAVAPAGATIADVTGLPSRSIGRDRETEVLTRDLNTAKGGAFRVALLAGEPGIGKTRLAADLSEHAVGAGVAVAWGRCDEGGGAPAYWPWAQLLDTIVRLVGLDAVQEAAGGRAADLSRLGADLFPATATELSDPEEVRFRTARAVTSLLSGLARAKPLLVVLDDLQWCDSSSLEVLDVVCRSLERDAVLIVATMRTGTTTAPAVARSLAQLARGPYRRIDLKGLDPATVAALVAEHGVDLDAVDLAALQQRTAGNPLFVSQIASWMGAEGAESHSRSLPTAVADVVRDRVAQLGADEARVLSEASVLGFSLDIDSLADLTGLEPSALLAVLEAPIGAELLVRDEVPGRWRFAHGLVADALRDALPADQRCRLHLRAAEGLRRGHDPVGPHLPAVAEHLMGAQPLAEPGEVVAALVAAATWNADQLTFEQAFGQVAKALEVVQRMAPGLARDSVELEVQGLRSRLVLTTRGYGDAELTDACRRMRELCSGLEPGHPAVVPVLWRLSVMHMTRCEWDTARSLGEELRVAGGDLVADIALGTIATHTGSMAAGRAYLDAALARLDEAGGLEGVIAETPRVWTRVFSAWNRWATGDPDGADIEVVAAVQDAALLGEGSYPHAFSLWFSGLLAVLRQDAPEAVRRCDAAIVAGERAGFGMLVPFMQAYRAWGLSRTGDPDIAIAELEAAAERVGHTGASMLSHVFPGFLADVHLHAGRPEEAALHAKQGLVAADETAERWYEAELYRLLGVATGDPDALKQAVALADRQGNLTLAARARASVADQGTRR